MVFDFLKERLTRESEIVPFTVFSVTVFWALAVAVLTGSFWVYPQLVSAAETKIKLDHFHKEFAIYRIEDRIDELRSEEYRLRREKERMKTIDAAVPEIYEEQLSKLVAERVAFERKLEQAERANTE